MAGNGNNLVLLLCFSLAVMVAESGIGVNWGTISNHRMSPDAVVDLLRDNKIGKGKLFDADPRVLRALMGSGIEVMVGIPNEMLALISSSAPASDLWVSQNISRYMVKGGVNIKYVAVGNEPFLASYSGQFQSYVAPAVANLQQSLSKANLAGPVKLVVPCNADAYESSLPSQGAFRPELMQTITQIVSFLSSNASPFVVSTDAHCSRGGGVANGRGPERQPERRSGLQPGPGVSCPEQQGLPREARGAPLDVYLFSLFDEEAKSVLPRSFERHWGIFSFDGQAKYRLNLGGGLLRNAKRVDYLPSRWCVVNPTHDLSSVASHFKLACSYADCTTLNYGGSCNGIGERGNISYAFNSYYQLRKQNPKSCEFDGMGMITFLDPSVGECRFLVGFVDAISSAFGLGDVMTKVVMAVAFWAVRLFEV